MTSAAIRRQPVAINDVETGDTVCSVTADPRTNVASIMKAVVHETGIEPIQIVILSETGQVLRENDVVGAHCFRTEVPFLQIRVRNAQEAHYEKYKQEALDDLKKNKSKTDLKHLHAEGDRDVVRMLKDDPEVIMAAIRLCNPAQLQHAGPNIKRDIDFMLEACRFSETCSYYVPAETWAVIDFTRGAMKIDGLWMKNTKIPTDIKNDIGVAMEAVTQTGYALQHCTPEIKNCKEVVLAAVHDKGLSLKYASEELKDDYDVVLQAVMENKNAIRHASAELKEDDKIRETAGLGPSKKAKEQSEKLKQKFQELDENHDGYLSFEELEALLRKGNSGMTKAEVRLLYDQLDSDHTGAVDFNEFCDFIHGL